MSSNIRETRLCIGFHKQDALQTPLVAADTWSLLKTNPSLFAVKLNTENDGPWIGKDDEFATKNYLTNWDIAGAIEGYLCSEWAAMIAAFGLGKVAKEAAGDGFKYTCTPLDPVADEIEMPSTTIVEAIRQGGSAVIDRALVGCVVQEFGFQLNSGPGLQGARFTSQWVGAKQVTPSTITVPAVTACHLLPAYSATAVILGADYITAKTLQSFEFRWSNAMRLDSGFFPGSGAVDGAQIRGRMEHGDRAFSANFVARFANGSTELDDLKDQTEGTAVITVTGDAMGSGAFHKLAITLPRTVIETAEIGDAEGIVTVAVNLLPMKHVSNGVLKIEVWTNKDQILGAAA